MGESSSSSRKRRRDNSASRSRSRPRKSGSRSATTSDKKSSRRRKSASPSRSRSRSRERERERERSHRRHKSKAKSSRRRSVSSASSRSRSRSRSPARKSKTAKDKDRKRSRRSSSLSDKRSRDSGDRKHASMKKDDAHRRRRSRSRSRSRSRRQDDDRKQPKELPAKSATRSRSRSSSRGQAASVAVASAGSTAPTKTLQTLHFKGISLKSDKKPTAKPFAAVASNGNARAAAAAAAADVDDQDQEKQRRREKLKLWREQQLQQQHTSEQQQQLVRNFLADDDAVPPQIQLWSVDVNGDEKEPESLEERKKKHEAQRQREQQVVDEVDPLDAYMAGLVDEAAIQQSIVNPAANVISLDEIQARDKLNIYGTFLPPTETLYTEPSASGSLPPTHAPPQVTGSETTSAAKQEETEQEREEREERELQEFMRALREKRKQEEKQAASAADEQQGLTNALADPLAVQKDDTGRIFQGFDEDVIGEEAQHIDQRSALEILQEAQKKKEIQPVDHTQVEYIPFQKKFYVVPKEIKDLSDDDVQAIRDELEIKVRGKNCPRPLAKWTQCGLSVRMLQLIQKQGYTEPFAIQRQALPAIMAGRDVIGIAKTGSGKTLAFLLPMFRHILHQPPLQEGEGPIGLIMAPARELAQQIYVEAKKFAKGLGMRATAVYGGSSVAEQIANLKRGSDVVICTPGRMIDILCMSAGKMVSLKRVTYVVLDEADRMFDMGFEPQITKIMLNIRPDRQTLLFSATFPKAVETLARKVLKKPVEITVGARSTASGDILQYVEVRDEKDKFMRLLQLLGLWYEKGNVLVFVNTQQACDQLFQDLMKAGYPALSLHGGKDQVDRDFTIDDFKRKVRTLMVATSVAGRGLDVKDLVLVINYHCPNHLEDYVHRVGRTGRAGRKGTAYTFISPDEEEYSVDLVKALESAKQVIPPELLALADGFKERVRKGEARYHGSGFKGKGFTFDESEKNETQRVADMQKRQYELSEGIVIENGDASDDDADSVEDTGPKAMPLSAETAAGTASAAAAPSVPLDNDALLAVRKAQQIAQILDRQYKQHQTGSAAVFDEGHFEEELEINDYPQQARWKVTQKEATERVAELTGVAVITRGSYVPAGRKPNPGERKLYLAIEGPTQVAVLEARRELQRILDETTLQVGLGGDRYGKYNV